MGAVTNNPSAALIAVAVILLLALIMRWVFKPARPRSPELPVDASKSPNLGLLTVVASGVSRHEAMRRRATLGEAGIRSSMSRRRDGRHDILVFNADAETARLLLDR
jgi:hypothetical protein